MRQQRILDTGNKVAVQGAEPQVQKNYFAMGFTHNFSGNIGYLYPAAWWEVLPGERWHMNCALIARLLPMVFPVYQEMEIRTETFYVRNRFMWNGFKDMIYPVTEGATPPAIPQVTGYTPNIGGRLDYYGLPMSGSYDDSDVWTYNPTPDNPLPSINVLPLAAYDKVWADHYADEDLEPECRLYDNPFLPDGEQPTPAAFDALYRVHWPKDYFTSAKPWPQKGPAIVIPFDVDTTTVGAADVYATPPADVPDYPQFATNNGTDTFSNIEMSLYTGGVTNTYGTPVAGSGAGGKAVYYDPKDTLKADIATALGGLINRSTINDLRLAAALQRFSEADSFGTRFQEGNYNHFRQFNSDDTINRSIYLGGTRQNLMVSEVLQTSPTVSGTTPQGTFVGHGITSAHHIATDGYECPEHGFIITMLRIIPASGYASQGIHRSFSRFNRFDYAFPELGNLGWQEVYNKEIFWAFDTPESDPTYNDNVFGYLQRYMDYKMTNDRVSGQFRTTLNEFHLARIFQGPVYLNETFINITYDEQKRIFAYEGTSEAPVDHVLITIKFNAPAIRPLPQQGIPHVY